MAFSITHPTVIYQQLAPFYLRRPLATQPITRRRSAAAQPPIRRPLHSLLRVRALLRRECSKFALGHWTVAAGTRPSGFEAPSPPLYTFPPHRHRRPPETRRTSTLPLSRGPRYRLRPVRNTPHASPDRRSS